MLSDYSPEFEKAKECAFWYINKRRYTKKELTEKLIKREYDRDLAIDVVNYLEEHGYIDDCDYARRYVHDAVLIKKHGAVRIKTELSLKGIKGVCVDEALQMYATDQDDVLVELVSSKAVNLDLNDEKAKNKLVAFLVRRGYKYAEIFEAIKTYRENKGEN